MRLHEQMRLWAEVDPDDEGYVMVPALRFSAMADAAAKQHRDTQVAAIEAYRLGKLDGYQYALALLDEIACGRDCLHAREAVLREIEGLRRAER